MTGVLVSGVAGRMGREVLKAVWNAEDMELTGAVDVCCREEDVGLLLGIGEVGLTISDDLEQTLGRKRPDVMVDFTEPRSVTGNIRTALKYRVCPVVGTTGMSREEIAEIIALSEEIKVGGLIAPNFAIGALLMIKFAAEAARYFPDVEIIELHHDQKVDAPSGTAVKTAEAILEGCGDLCRRRVAEIERLAGARGGEFTGGIRIHSVRLPGLVAHQEVIFGGVGQTLTIRHDSIARESFMPGVLLAIRKVTGLERVVYGLEKLLFE